MDSFIDAVQRRHEDAFGTCGVADMTETVWRELVSEVLSHLDAASLARAAPACRVFYNSMEQAVRARVAASPRLLPFDQPEMEGGACTMWRTQPEDRGCRCAWLPRFGWAAVLHRVESREVEMRLLQEKGWTARALLQHWPMHRWTAHTIVAINPTRFPGTQRYQVRIDRPQDGTTTWSMAHKGRHVVPVWMQFVSNNQAVAEEQPLPALAELLYQDGYPPSALVMTDHAAARVEERGALLTHAPAHSFTFAPSSAWSSSDRAILNPRMDVVVDEAILQTLFARKMDDA